MFEDAFYWQNKAQDVKAAPNRLWILFPYQLHEHRLANE